MRWISFVITTGLFSSGSRDHVGCFLFNDLIELFSIFMDPRAILTVGNNRSIYEYYEKKLFICPCVVRTGRVIICSFPGEKRIQG